MLTDPLDTTGAIVALLALAFVSAAWWLTDAPGRARAVLALPLLMISLALMWAGQRAAHAAAWIDGEAIDFGDHAL